MAENKKSAGKLIFESQESLYQQAVRMMNMDQLIVQYAFKVENYRKTAEMFEQVGDYADAAELAEKCRRLAAQTQQEEKEYRYQRAADQKASAKSAKGYEKAEKLFAEAAGYKDAEQQREECCRQRKVLEKKAKREKIGKLCCIAAVILAVIAFFVSPAWTNLKIRLLGGEQIEDPRGIVTEQKEITVENAEIGDQVSFGTHEWYVLDADEASVKMILFHAEKYEEFRHTPYHDTLKAVTWEQSSLRQWLNTEFLEQNFSEEEQQRILTTQIENKDNPVYGTSGGNDTSDKVFLLSAEEVERYQDTLKHIRMNLWLRSPGNSEDTAAFMAANNKVIPYGHPVDGTEFYTCPVICVSRN